MSQIVARRLHRVFSMFSLIFMPAVGGGGGGGQIYCQRSQNEDFMVDHSDRNLSTCSLHSWLCSRGPRGKCCFSNWDSSAVLFNWLQLCNGTPTIWLYPLISAATRRQYVQPWWLCQQQAPYPFQFDSFCQNVIKSIKSYPDAKSITTTVVGLLSKISVPSFLAIRIYKRAWQPVIIERYFTHLLFG